MEISHHLTATPNPYGSRNQKPPETTADLCKQHLREKYPNKLALVEEFIVEIEGPPKTVTSLVGVSSLTLRASTKRCSGALRFDSRTG